MPRVSYTFLQRWQATETPQLSDKLSSAGWLTTRTPRLTTIDEHNAGCPLVHMPEHLNKHVCACVCVGVWLQGALGRPEGTNILFSTRISRHSHILGHMSIHTWSIFRVSTCILPCGARLCIGRRLSSLRGSRASTLGGLRAYRRIEIVLSVAITCSCQSGSEHRANKNQKKNKWFDVHLMKPS